VRAIALVPAVLLAAGLGLVILSVLQGGASLAIVVIVPVLYGRSLEFLAGALLFVAGLFTLPLAFGTDVGPVTSRSEAEPTPWPEGPGGLILLGPVPILFGSWKGVSTRTRGILAVIGSAIVVAAIVLLVLAVL